jgi:hypothetical protein
MATFPVTAQSAFAAGSGEVSTEQARALITAVVTLRFTPEELLAELRQTVEHAFLDCPNHETARRKHLNARDKVQSLLLIRPALRKAAALQYVETLQ